MSKELTIPLFFKVGERVKKATFVGSTMSQLKRLFVTRFSESGFSGESLDFPFYITDRESGVSYELESIEDLYQNCILEYQNLASSQKTSSSPTNPVIIRDKYVVVMVGLPGRGKTQIAQKLARYLNWIGISTKVFIVGDVRRSKLGKQPVDFFDPENKDAFKIRLHIAILCLYQMIDWLWSGGCVGIYDATNQTRKRRDLLLSRLTEEGFKVIFIESLCNDPSVLEFNENTILDSAPYYQGTSREEAKIDFESRQNLYSKLYQTLTNDNVSYIQLFDLGVSLSVNKIDGYLPSRMLFFLMCSHITSRPILLVRHGESEYNAEDRIGGNPPLTEKGNEFAHKLSQWIQKYMADNKITELVVWTSTLKRSIQTAAYIPLPKVSYRSLDEIDVGICDGMSYEEFAKNMPEEFELRKRDKLAYRYPRGESYEDLITRLEPLVLELEGTRKPVLIVGHQAVLRCLYGYFLNLPPEETPYIPVPFHTVIQVIPKAYAADIQQFKLC